MGACRAADPAGQAGRRQAQGGPARGARSNSDWEAHATFWSGLRLGKTENEALEWMDETFNVKYRKQGMLFALGNMAKRPQTWQLLGVIRADEPLQQALPF